MGTKSKWTILTYIAAHNNLQEMGKRSLEQIIGVGSTPQVMHAVLFDGMQGAGRYIVGDSGKILPQYEIIANYDSGDPDRLVEIARWVFEQYPAERYGLVLWSHGTGWMPHELQEVARQARGDEDVTNKEVEQSSATTASPALFRTTVARIMKQPSDQRAVCFDDGSQHSIDTVELENVTDSISTAIGQPLDLLGMDACLMASLEVAYQIRQSTRYLVASEELVPGTSWPYDTIFEKLKQEPEMSGHDLAVLITNDYLDFYTKHTPPLGSGDVTKVALDLSKVETISQAIDRLGKAIIAKMGSEAQTLWSAQVNTRKHETINGQRQPNKFSLHLWDIRTLVNALAKISQEQEVLLACQAVSTAFEPGGAVIREAHLGDWFTGIGGVSVYLAMPNQTRITPYYPLVSFAHQTSWDKMLDLYHNYGKFFKKT